MTFPSLFLMTAVRGIFPGRLWVAQELHGSYALKAISTMFRSPGETSKLWIRPFAAFLTSMFMEPLLLVVPTTRLHAVTMPFSSQV